LIREFTKYYETKYKSFNDITDSMPEIYKELSDSLYKLNPLFRGFDGEKDKNADSFKIYEVIPNQKRLSTDGNTYFGYNVFDNFLKPNGDLLNISGYTDYYENTLGVHGNFELLFSQINDGTHVHLPKSTTVNSSTPTNYYEYHMNYDYVCEGGAQSYDVEGRFNTYMSLTGIYTPKYVFEKLNHEFLEFTNKTFGLMNIDYTNDNNCNIDVIYNESFNLNATIDLVGLNNKTEVLKTVFDSDSIFTDIKDYSLLFNNELTEFVKAYKILERGFTFNDWNTISGNTFTQSSGITTDLQALYDVTGRTVNIKYYIEFVFLGYIKQLISNKTSIIKEFNDYVKANPPITGVIAGVANTTNINKINSMKTILDNLFNELEKVYFAYSEINTKLVTKYKTTVIDNIKPYIHKNLMNKYGFTGPLPASLSNIGNSISNSLSKGLEADYTVLMRQVSDVPIDVLTVLINLNS
jgi:hypothetical protein